MNSYRHILTATAAALLLAGCGKKTAQNTEPEPAPAQGPVQSFVGGPAAPAQSSVRRGMEIQKAKQYLYDFKTFYIAYKTEQNRVPRNLKEFTDYLGQPGATLAKLLHEQAFTVNFKPNLPGDALVAYVSWEDGSGNRAVLTEAGEIKVMNRSEFEQAVKR